MPGLDEISWMCANVVAAAKERAIREAFNNHFACTDWEDTHLAELDLECVVDLVEKKETLSINGVPVLELGLMNCRIDIDCGIVQCLYEQSIKPLYSCCGVGS